MPGDGVRPRRVFLYGDPATREVAWEAVARYVEATTGVPVELRGEFVAHHGADVGALASTLAAARVVDPWRPREPPPPPGALVAVEARFLRDPARLVPGVLYDGLAVMEAYRSLLPPPEATLAHVHVVFTRRLLGTFDEGDRRYHARTLVAGFPCLVSTSGLVEAPAKPREFYLRRRGASALGIELPAEALKADLGARFLDYGDPRTTEVAKGYALQAYAYHALGDPFCGDPTCRLFNAHWQEEMLRAQVASGSLCRRHAALLAGEDPSTPIGAGPGAGPSGGRGGFK